MATFPELQEEENLAARRSAPQSEAESHVSSINMTLSDLEDRRAERELKLQLAKLKLAAEEKKAEAETALAGKKAEAETALAEKKAEADRGLEERRLALEEKNIFLAHEVSQKELDLKAKQLPESSNKGGRDNAVSRGSTFQRIWWSAL